MLEHKLKLLILILLINFYNCAYYSWDQTTRYAHFYDINGTKATSNDQIGRIIYVLTTKQTVPNGTSKVSARINSYGQQGSTQAIFLNFGLITQANKNKMQMLHNYLGSLEYTIYQKYSSAKVCLDARCFSDTYKRELFVPVGQIIELYIDTDNLQAYFYVPSKKLEIPISFNSQYWKNQKIFVFFGINNIGGSIQLLS